MPKQALCSGAMMMSLTKLAYMMAVLRNSEHAIPSTPLFYDIQYTMAFDEVSDRYVV